MVHKNKRKKFELALFAYRRRSFIAITRAQNSPVEKRMDVHAVYICSQMSPSMKDPAVKVLASDAPLITR
jgi:hypothetical protein